MADPIQSNNNIFPQAAANRQDLIDAVEAAREHDRIKNFAKSHGEKMKKEANEISGEMGHDAKIDSFKTPGNRFPEDEKTAQRMENEKKECIARKMERTDGNYWKDLKKDLVSCREMYASVEYNNRAALAGIRKFFGSKKVEDSVEIKSALDQYQKTLSRFKEAKVEEFKDKGLSGEKLNNEITELVKQFGYMEAVDLYNARKETKAEKLMGRDVVKKCWGMLEKTESVYNKLPLWSKLGLSAATVVLGISMATGAAAAVGVAGAAGLVIGAKRALGGVVAGVGTAKGLDAL